MYKVVAQTIFELANDPKYLGAKPGFFSILHTWGQDLRFHPHIHTVVLAGGLNKVNQWCSSSKDFFIPVKVLAKKFRGKFLFYLKQYYHNNVLQFFNEAKVLENPEMFQKLIDKCYGLDWYSYTKKPFSNPLAVVKYLGRYTHKIAISNRRIIAANEHTVTFKVRDYKAVNHENTVTLTGIEFIRRFMMHILPKGFVKIRHYGILANRNKKTKLKLCRKLTGSPLNKPRFEGLSIVEIISLLAGKDVTVCPVCQKSKLPKTNPCYLATPT